MRPPTLPALWFETPHIDAVLALAKQMGRVRGIYPTFPEDVPAETLD